MALQTITTIKIGEIIIDNFSNLILNQKIHDHHTFSIEVRQELLVDEIRSIVPASQDFFGEKISIEIKPLPGLDDVMIIANPKDYILQFYGIVTNVKLKNSRLKDVEKTILIEGCSTSILLDNGPESNSFVQMPLADIVNKVKSGYDIDMQVLPFYNDRLAYTVQYNESDFKFLNRLAKRYGQWFFYNGRIIVFGGPGGGISQKLVYGINLYDFHYKIKLVPSLFKILENDNKEGKIFTDHTINYRKEVDGFHQNLINKSNAVFNKETLIQLNQNAAGGYGSTTAEEYTKNKMRASFTKMMQVKASSEVPGITVGTDVIITGVDKQQEGYYSVTQITHTCDDGGSYENHFTAVNLSGSVFSPKTNPDLVPKCKSQTAIVTENADPDGLSSVKVQMPWQQAKGETTPYIPLLQKYGGDARGSHIIPEIGDTVFVDFQGDNAELPIVVGTMTSRKEKSSYSTPNNDIKALHTRSNNLLLMNDAVGSVLLQDSTKSFLEMDGNRRIELNTDIFEINVKKLIINASESTQITTNDYILNALSKIYIISKMMQQKISGFMNLYSGKALINSNETIDIEAKIAKLHGKEKALLHSDNEAIINSSGTAKMHGASGNSLTNTAKTVSASPTDAIALAVVYFRPLTTWNGEFGFDWLREKDNGLNIEPDYESIVEGGYKDGVSDLNRVEAYTKLKLEYNTIPITRKPTTAGSTSPTPAPVEYSVPYLTLFSKEFVDALPATTLIKPCYKAELKIFVDIEEDLDKLKFDYDDNLFELNTTVLTPKSKTNGLEDKNVTIKIKCLKDLDRDRDINIYAYPKSVTIASRATLEPNIDQRKLAGKIRVLKNDNTARKEGKFALIRVRTNVTNIPITGLATGSFSPTEKQNLYNTLHQALIIPTIEEMTLDLSNNTDFRLTGKHLSGLDIKYSYINGIGIEVKNPALYSDCQSALLNFKDASGVLVNTKYNDYFTIFKFGINSNKGSVLGAVDGIGIQNVIMFTLSGGDDCTLNHETLHGLGLYHTHRNSSPVQHSNIKYIYPNALNNPIDSTDNVMCYRNVAYTTWQWQWKIINSNIN